ncbi:MAG: hypothetical protein ACJ76I_08205 [Gaiellaceae bacterium]
MPDEAIYADRALAFWRHGSFALFHGEGAGYGLLYPVVAGLPLAAGGLTTLKVVQALVMSLAAVPVFLYGRRLMSPPYALLAAVLTVASPLLLYSGFVMTEVLFYPLAALMLLAAARAVQTATLRDQAIGLALILLALATRAQAVVFVGVLALAALLDCLLVRDRARLRAFWPTWAALLVTAFAALATPGVLGSYAGTVSSGYPIGPSLRLTYDHLAYLVLFTGVLPAAALALLAIDVVRGREREPGVRALVLVSLCATFAVVAQVGFFAARFAPHVLGRDLASVPPLLFLVFALYLSRRRRYGLGVLAGVCFAELALLALAPWDHIVVHQAIPDSFDLGLLYRLSASIDAATLVTVAGLAALVLFAVLPTRLRPALPVLVLLFFVATSVATSRLIAPWARADDARLVGSPRDWVDRAVHANVTYVYDGDPEWNSVWQQRFWDRRIAHVLSLPPARVPGPMTQTTRAPTASGGLAIRDGYAVAADRLTFFGTPVAHHTRGIDLATLTLWRLDGPPRLSTITRGIQPNGDMIGPADLVAYRCAGGRLELTLLPKATDDVTVLLDGKRVLRHHIAGLLSWHASVQVPRSHRGRCRFTIRGGLLLGSTVRSFERP